MLLLRSAGLNIYAIPKVKNIDILFSQNRSCAGARTLYLVRFPFFCMLYVLCFLPYHSSIFPGHACFSVPCCLGLPLPVILLHSRKAFPAFPYGLSRVLKWAFPHCGKAFSMLLKMPSDAFSPARRWYSDCYLMRQKVAYTRAEGLPSVYARFSATLHRMNIHSSIIILHEYAFLLCVSSSAFPRLGSPFFPIHRSWLVVLLVLSYGAFVSFIISVHSLSFVLRMICFHFPAYCCCMVVFCFSPRRLVLLYYNNVSFSYFKTLFVNIC